MAPTPDSTKPAFSAETARAVLDVVCTQLAIECDDAELMRLGENALYRLHSKPFVVRIARGPSHRGDAEKEVAVAKWLAKQRFPAAQAIDLPEQPIIAKDHPVTIWRYIEGTPARREDVGTLGNVLRQLHALPSPQDYHLPALDAFNRVEPRVQSAQVPDSDKDFLLGLCAELREQWASLDFALPSCVIHGDAHIKNIMMVADSPVLIDLERFAWGPPEWDLAKTATEYQTAGFWSAQEYSRFVEAYGFDVTTWSGFPVLRATESLAMVSWLMQNVSHGEAIADEYRARIDTLRGRRSGSWTPF